MESGSGIWVPLDVFSVKKGVSKGTLYRLINRGEIVKRFVDGAIEIFVVGEDAALFDNLDSSLMKGNEVEKLDFKIGEDDDFGIAAQSLRTLMSMHKEVLAEKHRMLSEWEGELANREEQLVKLGAALAEKDNKLDEKNDEIRNLRMAFLRAEETKQRFEHDLQETRDSLHQFNELIESNQKDWDRITGLFEEKDKIIEAKDEIIHSLESSVGQNEMAVRESTRIIEEQKRIIEKTREILRDKEEILKMMESEPGDLDGKLAARDNKIMELISYIKTLEEQVETVTDSKELTGFDQDPDAMTSLIQDQLEYLMTSQSAHESIGEDEAEPPSEDENEIPEEESEQ